MARPTRFCTCGEYVDNRPVTRPDGHGGFRTSNELVHVDGDGTIVYRGHKAREDFGAACGGCIELDRLGGRIPRNAPGRPELVARRDALQAEGHVASARGVHPGRELCFCRGDHCGPGTPVCHGRPILRVRLGR